MKRRFAELAAKFNVLQKREKQLVSLTVVVVIVMGGFSFWVEPAQLRADGLRKEIARQKNQAQQVEAQLATLTQQLKDPNAPVKAALADVRSQIAAADRVLREYDKNLVPADQMPQLLQALFARHRGVELVSLQTLPPAPLLAAAPAKPEAGAEAKTAKPAGATPPTAKGSGIVKHGIEIRMAGGYLDLLGYLTELENLPQKLLWGRMALASAYPRSELTLTVYTLSLDSVWMVM
jgi:MSHA biogenesis protein MshJ